MVAAYILDPNKPIEGLNDSKKLTGKKRFDLCKEIMEKSFDYCIVEITRKEIDHSNILAMRMEGMKRTIEGLKNVDYAIVDGSRLLQNLSVPADFMIKGYGTKIHREALENTNLVKFIECHTSQWRSQSNKNK